MRKQLKNFKSNQTAETQKIHKTKTNFRIQSLQQNFDIDQFNFIKNIHTYKNTFKFILIIYFAASLDQFKFIIKTNKNPFHNYHQHH